MKINKVKSWWKYLEKYPRINWKLSVIWLLILSCVAFLFNLGSIGLVDKTEPMFVEAARQMSVTGDWITPYWNGETRFDKPPLVYWLMAIAFKIVGVNEWAARLPSALAAIALVVLGFYTLRYFGFSRPAMVRSLPFHPKDAEGKPHPQPLPVHGEGSKSREAQGEENDRQSSEAEKIHNPERELWISAWIGAAILALNPAWIAWGRTGVSDMLLASNISMALLTFFIAYAIEDTPLPVRGGGVGGGVFPQRSSIWYIAFYVFVALAVLAKGPVGAVLPGLIIGAFLLYLGKFREVVREMRLVRGVLITIAIAIPWFVLVTLANGKAYIDTFFGYHNVQRFTSVVSSHRGPWYFYIPVVLVGFAPWSIYLPVAIARLRFWQREKWQQSPRSTQLGLFALFWFIGVFGFFSIAVTKLPSYVLPLMPACAIMVTLFWSELMSERESRGAEDKKNKKNIGLFVTAIFNIVFLLVLAAGTFFSPKLIGYDPAVPQMRQALSQTGLPTLSGIVWLVTAIASVFLVLRKQQWRWLWSTNLAGFMAFMIFVAPPAALLLDRERQLPLREISVLINQVRQPEEDLILIGFIRPSMTFYTRQTVNYIKTSDEAISYIEKTAATKPTHLILTKPDNLKPNFLKRYQYQQLGSSGAYKLLRISKKVKS
ncbi:ArnT family glycosyltransferase [Aerosakkonema funiforme]|uniref:ArnT family glycosyltransferase n=1 Tax=Aerosakkonema funiforme TaxID=1246630 RepID=UPI0035B76D67